MENKKCIECGAYKGHSPNCEKIDLEEAKKQLKIYFESYQNRQKENTKKANDYSRWAKIMRADLERWRGKFLIVTQENNKLRKKLNDKF